ncbi:hypothetical protein G647_01833 [Cladophialophora carrionii CBS 160.54]|uniref:Uncharacterized protein n=1 Tax=Cladophialophora carrionii CBS 160.54 TaxID=1279043 RepID=V9DR57_9EURO|nr:uncharacterized protein G647_01833 [Cladophialophora carrionii CBS 160.54]ETI29380.1 hypothetical protein G647_01833 [Cladophialophora carrionii CBS 160.54]
MDFSKGFRHPFSPVRFEWDDHFSERQVTSYVAEDIRLELEPTETITTAFLDVRSRPLDPVDFNFKRLADFLDTSDIRNLRNPNVPAQGVLALLDDRRDPCGLDEGQPGQPPTSNGQTRNWVSEQYTRFPTPGVDSYRRALDERGLHDRLRINNKSPRDFTMEFHLPYCALRRADASFDPRNFDPRGLRRAYPMLPNYKQPQDQLYYYDAQISVLVTGVDEWYWTAYCCVDTFSKEPEKVETYMRHKSDGPSAGGGAEHYPLWNPREYFLLVLSRRCTQVAREWEAVINDLIARLDTYETAYYKSMAGDGNDFFDDAQLGRTKSYTNAVYIMRKFNDTLSLSLDTFQDFQQGELLYFDTGNKQHDEAWKRYFDTIYEDLASMRYLQRVLLQKIQTFDRMKDDVCT